VLLPTTEDYDAAIRAVGGMDLVILGLGERGHIAYDEPGVDFGAPTHENKLADVTRNALAESFGGLDAVPTHGVTMGIATILAAKRIMLLAFGENKANAAQKTLEGRPETFIPASFLQLHTDVSVYLDHAAASKLG
jgi:glucosamine-6-phosphate deaminase